MPTDDGILEDHNKRIEDLEARVSAVETGNNLRSLFESAAGIAYLTPGESGYSLIETDHGLLAISFRDISPYANGSRVTLRIGNTTNADLTGANAQIEWGPVDDSGTADNTKMSAKEVKFNDTFNGGSWTDIQVVLDATPPSDVGFLRVKEFDVDSISLSSP